MRRGSPSPPCVAACADPIGLSDAAAAFDTIADEFDARYSAWASVAAQRRAVRRWLEGTFPPGATVLELGAGTGEDATYLASRGYRVVATDPSPRMIAVTRRKSAERGLSHVLMAEPAEATRIAEHASEWRASGLAPFDGAYSNFAALNCVDDLTPVAQGLATVLQPHAPLALVLFGPLPPGEILIQLAHGKPRAAFRRMRHTAPARLGGRTFSVRYHRPRHLIGAFAPWFVFERRVGIGVFVPPSAAEPEISRYPRLLGALERLDAMCERPLAVLGDHVLYLFRRTDNSPSQS